MKIKYKKNGRRKECEYNSPYAVDNEAACLGILWNEKYRGQNLEPAWEILTKTGKHEYAKGRFLEIVSFEASELEKKGFFDFGLRKTINKKCKPGYARLCNY